MPPWSPRVLVLPASLLGRHRTIGGGERYAFEFARALARQVPTTLGLFDLSEDRQVQGDLEIRTFGVRHYSFRWVFPATSETWRALAEYDVVHLMCFPTPLSDALVPLARWRRQTVVLTDVGGGGRCWSGYLKKLHPRLDRHRFAHGLAHLSKHASTFFPDWSQPGTVLFGGARPEAYPAGEPQGYALFVGRLLPHKGVWEAIQAVTPEMPLRVVGRPYSEEYFQRLKAAAAGKNVTFITDASDADLARHYAGANVVLQVSLPDPTPAGDKSELLGLVALEGMAAGKPVIVTRTTSLPELVVDGVTGYIVPPHDLAALRDRIGLLLRDPELSRQLGAQANGYIG
jgi:glycosyltransferase involved in cell wall biosynthesis